MASIPSISAESLWQPAARYENQESPGVPVLLGESVAVRRLRSQIRRIAPYFRVALIHGETGSGKELVARSLHAASPVADGPFVEEEASALAEPFVHGDGPRPIGIGALESLLESAHGGTLYVRGTNKLSAGLQAGMLRFLFTHEERRGAARENGGGQRARRDARARIIAASDHDLRTVTAIGQFRQELYAYLSAVEMFVPPLRERAEDIPALSEWLLRRLSTDNRRTSRLLTDAALSQLEKARWPGNLRDLEQVLCRAAVLAEGAAIEPRHLHGLVESETGDTAAPPEPRPERLDDVIQQHVFEVLGRCGGNKLRAAARLGISRSTLYRMLEASGMGAAH